MMKFLRTLVAFLALGAAATAGAQAPDVDKVRAALKKHLPEVNVDSIRKTTYGNLYEVIVSGDIFYTDSGGGYLLMGSIVDLKTKENVTELRQREINRVDFDKLPLDNAFKIVRGDGSRKVAMFADPNCGYCKRFERDLLGIDNVTVYVFLYPILAADSVEKSKAVWCSADRGKLWVDHMVRDQPIAGDTQCATPIEKNLAFGRDKKVQGTPTIFFQDGDRVPGAMPIADFEKKLVAAAAKVAKK